MVCSCPVSACVWEAQRTANNNQYWFFSTVQQHATDPSIFPSYSLTATSSCIVVNQLLHLALLLLDWGVIPVGTTFTLLLYRKLEIPLAPRKIYQYTAAVVLVIASYMSKYFVTSTIQCPSILVLYFVNHTYVLVRVRCSQSLGSDQEDGGGEWRAWTTGNTRNAEDWWVHRAADHNSLSHTDGKTLTKKLQLPNYNSGCLTGNEAGGEQTERTATQPPSSTSPPDRFTAHGPPSSRCWDAPWG